VLSWAWTEIQGAPIFVTFSESAPTQWCVCIGRTPCGFCFVEYYLHEEALACMRYVSGSKLDERIIRCDLDLGYKEGRQFGRGKSCGQASLVFLRLAVHPSYHLVFR
jgi:hypothetical protein